MKQSIFTILLLGISNFMFANFEVKILNPTPGQVTNSIIFIEAAVQSEIDLNSVVAFVQNQQTALSYDIYSSRFKGSLSMAGFEAGDTLLLFVTATDFLNNKQSDSLHFIYAPLPDINAAYPLVWSDAHAPLAIKASCSGTGPCNIEVSVILNDTVYFNKIFNADIDTVIQINASGYLTGTINFTAKDQWGQTSTISRMLFYVDDPKLVLLYSGTGRIFDFNYGRTLESDNGFDSPDKHQAKGSIVDITTLEKTIIENIYPVSDEAFITPYGAVFYTYNYVFDFNRGDLSSYFSLRGLQYAGDYLTWVASSASEYALWVRNLNTRENTLVAENAFSSDNTVSKNGTVFYAYNSQLRWYNSGTSGPITEAIYNYPPPFDSFRPVTDGNYLLYYNIFKNSEYPYTLCLHDGQGAEIELSNLGTYTNEYTASPGLHYQVNNKFVAYCKRGIFDQLQIWLRDSTGNNNQVTFHRNDCTIEMLTANGDIIYQTTNEQGLKKRYHLKYGSLNPVEIGENYGKLYYRNSTWFLSIGNCLYLYNITPSLHQKITTANGTWTDAQS
ncbi:MAG TPA: hypothetical protein PKC39_09350 [Ferruginibacter sp.]|nr:hypothetical protein [Ferruginibacter sp.]HMP21152.1 hypothetical protein [Ferruginibacter sp.]